MDGFHDEEMEKKAKEWGAKLSAKERAYIQEKYHMLPEEYYVWYQKSVGFKKMASSAIASCSQWTEHAKKASAALQGYEEQIAEMGMGEVSDRQIAQMTNNLLYGVANTLESLRQGICSMQTSTLQQYAVASSEARSAKNNEYKNQEAWREELDRSEIPSWYYTGTAAFPEVPKRDFSSSKRGNDAGSDKKKDRK